MFVFSVPFPFSPILETQLSTLRVRPPTRPNDRFLERGDLSHIWLATLRPGPNERRPESLSRHRWVRHPFRRRWQEVATRGGTNSCLEAQHLAQDQDVASWPDASSGSSSITAGVPKVAPWLC